MSTKHTPGPWRKHQQPGASLFTIVARDRNVASVAESEDARLIALAPELADVLRDFISGSRDLQALIDRSRELLGRLGAKQQEAQPMTYPPLTDAQINALRAFRHALTNPSGWKPVLRAAWSGSHAYMVEPDDRAELQALRNTHGLTWLARHRVRYER